MDMNQVRRQQLRRLVGEYEGMTKLAHKLGLKKGAYISQLLTDPPVRTISEKTARNWERKLSLPIGWMDGAVPDKPKAAPPPIDAALLAQALAAVTDALAAARIDLPPAKVAELVTMQYSDALVLGRVDPARIQLIVGLIQR